MAGTASRRVRSQVSIVISILNFRPSDVISHKHPHFLTLGLVFTIWAASSGFAAIIDGLDVVYRVRETRPVWKTRPIALGLTLLSGSLLLLAVGLTVDGTTWGIWLAGRFTFKPFVVSAWRYLRWGIAILFAVLAVELLYHFGPDMKRRFRDSLIGAMIAVMTWIGLSYLLGITSGTSIIWIGFYLSGFVILVGGEINFLLGELRAHRTPQPSTSARSQVNNLNEAA